MDTVLSTKGLNKTFFLGGQRVYALRDIELAIHAGEVCCIVGPSGSGKSTLLNQLAGLDKPTSGNIIFCGSRLEKMNETQLAWTRLQNAGFVFQSYNLLPFLSAIENVAFPLMLKKQPYIMRMRRAKTELAKIGLGNRLAHRPHQMSGGQQQRVGIARAFVTEPRIIFADEPTGNLDSKTTEVVLEYMLEKVRRTGTTLVMVTHEQRLAECADHVIEMMDGARHMKKKGFRCFAYILICIILSSRLSASAFETDRITTSSESSAAGNSAAPESEDGDSSEIPAELSSEVLITGYTIYAKDGSSRVNSITKDQQVVIHVNIVDSREQVISCEPSAVVNTSSFRPVSSTSKGDATYSATNQGGIYTLVFTCQYTGSGNTFAFDLSYPGSGVEMQYITIGLNQCVEYVEPEATPAPEATPEPEVTVKGTGFALKSLNYSPYTVYAGSQFELMAEILATKGDYAAEDVSVSLSLPAGISTSDGNIVQYIGTVQPGNQITATFALSADAAAEQDSYTIIMDIRGVSSEDGAEITSSIEIPIPVKQIDRFEISKLSLPEQLNASYDDGQGYTTIYFINKGKTPIYNITVSIEGDSLTASDGSIYFGNLEPGKEGSVDCNLVAGGAGALTGNIILTYETSQGAASEIKQEFTVNAAEGEVIDSADAGPINVDITEENSVPAWIWVLIGMAAVFLWSSISHFIRKKRAEQLALLEEGTPDDSF